MNQLPNLKRVGDTRDVLGESPVWSIAENALYWVDIRGQMIRRLDGRTGHIRSWPMPELVGSVGLRKQGGVIAALRTGIALFDTDSGALTRFPAPHADQPQMRFNEGKCDRQGRFWAGSMDDIGRGPVGVLYRFESGEFIPVITGVSVPNSLCWSLDDTTMFFSDGIGPAIWAYPFEASSGTVGTRRLFARLPDGTGIPDGATIDAQGYLWSANYGGNQLIRFRPDGTVDKKVLLPVSQPTSCCFGGGKLDILFVTSASQRLTPEQLRLQPDAGGLLSMRPGVSGWPEPAYAG